MKNKNLNRGGLKLKIFLTIYIIGILFLVGSTPAFATTYDFYNITNSDPISLDVAEQLSVDVERTNNNQVLFTFYNAIRMDTYTAIALR